MIAKAGQVQRQILRYWLRTTRAAISAPRVLMMMWPMSAREKAAGADTTDRQIR